MPSQTEGSRPPYFVPRKATARTEDGRSPPAELSQWRDKTAYVLLGEPGAGKSEAFRMEADACNAVYTSARNFAALLPRQEWATFTIFIDGLDEMRAGSTDRHAPLDVIRSKLDQLGRPRFRLSCREADWLGVADADALREITADRVLTELRLEPLGDSDVLEVLNKCPDRVADANEFWHEAERRQLQPLLRNPLLLQLMIDAVSGSNWPSSRAETFELACLRAVVEMNPTHATARRNSVIGSEQSLDNAGLICAVLLLSGEIGVSLAAAIHPDGYLSIQELSALVSLEEAERVMASKLFLAIGDQRIPRHRALAEYLAGRAVSKRCTQYTLPVSRVLALMSGVDGTIVEPLRGFNAWLAALCPAVRDLLIERDPLGVILYGDVRQFSPASKAKLLLALKREAEQFAWFRSGDWTAHPFGALGTRDMQAEFVRLIQFPARDPVHYSVLDCVLDAILYGEELPLLAAPLIALIRDSTYPEHIRSSAIDAWLVHAGTTSIAAVEILQEITAGIVRDDSDELTGKLLKVLYPGSVSANDILAYFHDDKAPDHMGAYKLFWSVYFLKATHEAALPDLADALALRFDQAAHRLPPTGLPGFIGELVCITIERFGDRQSASRLYGWLGIGIDEYGSARFDRDDALRIGRWLTTHPAVFKDVFSYGLDQIRLGSERARAEILACHERLCGARLPPDWIPWLLTEAARVTNPQVAQHCVQLAANGAMTQNLETGASFEYVAVWADTNRCRWPEVSSWIEDAWSVPVDDWRREEWKRKAKAATSEIAQRANRRSLVTEHFAEIEAGTAAPALLRDLAHCVNGPLQDIVGETPHERLREYLVGSDSEVLATLAGLQRALDREDLPTCEAIFDLARIGREHYLLIVCLVGAQLQYAADPTACLRWSERLTRTMVAFWLTHGAGDEPLWYSSLVGDKPELIAEVFEAHAKIVMARGGAHTITGLWRMAQDGAPSSFANIVLPPLLTEFPLDADGQALIALDGGLLPAAVRSVHPATLANIAWQRLSQAALNPVQRMSWLVFALTISEPTRQQAALDSITATVFSDGTFGPILASDLAVHKEFITELLGGASAGITFKEFLAATQEALAKEGGRQRMLTAVGAFVSGITGYALGYWVGSTHGTACNTKPVRERLEKADYWPDIIRRHLFGVLYALSRDRPDLLNKKRQPLLEIFIGPLSNPAFACGFEWFRRPRVVKTVEFDGATFSSEEVREVSRTVATFQRMKPWQEYDALVKLQRDDRLSLFTPGFANAPSADVFAEECLLDSTDSSACDRPAAQVDADKSTPRPTSSLSRIKQACQALDTAYRAQSAAAPLAAR